MFLLLRHTSICSEAADDDGRPQAGECLYSLQDIFYLANRGSIQDRTCICLFLNCLKAVKSRLRQTALCSCTLIDCHVGQVTLSNVRARPSDKTLIAIPIRLLMSSDGVGR